MSGTSMASPYIAGIAALYISKQKKLGNSKGPSNRAILLKNKIIASGVAIPWFDGKTVDTDVNAPVSQAGAGYVDAWKVVNYVTSISPAKIELGPTNQFRSTQTIKVTNEGDKPIHYYIVHVPDPGVCTSKPGGVAWSFPPQLAPAITAKVSFDPNGFDVAPGQTYSVDLQFEHPASGPEDCMFPTYSGRLELSGTSDNYREDLVIPYLGVAGDSSKVSVLSPRSKFYYKQPRSKERFNLEGEIFTLDRDDRPGFFMNLLLGAREYKFELVTPDWKPNDWNYRPQYGYPPYMGQVFPNRRLQPRGSRELVLEDEILIDALSRDKRCIPDGQYMLLFSALKLSGDPFKRDSWDVELSPVFGVESIDGCDEREWRGVTWR
ncbi:hypothetical protein FRC02_010235 [Tulasnella sp. 418]|nr:hypothetical protein FRC02_010235 [Tulasnella sp. 418]